MPPKNKTKSHHQLMKDARKRLHKLAGMLLKQLPDGWKLDPKDYITGDAFEPPTILENEVIGPVIKGSTSNMVVHLTIMVRQDGVVSKPWVSGWIRTPNLGWPLNFSKSFEQIFLPEAPKPEDFEPVIKKIAGVYNPVE